MSFGTAFGATPGFGAQPATSGLFGTPAAQPSQPTGFSFGTQAANPTPGNLFGATNPAPANTSFGFGNVGQPTVGAAAAAPGFAFTTPATSSTPLTTGFGVLQAPQAAPSSGFGGFGAPSLAPSSAPGFGALGTNFAASQPSINPTQPKLGLSFGAPAVTTSATAGFGGLSFGLGTSSAPTTTAPTLNFGTTPAVTTASTALTFGLGTSTAPTGGLSLGFGTPSITPATTAPVVGLGGIATTTPLTSSAAAKTEQSPREQLLPNEIQQTVDTFKLFVKQQKSNSSDVARCSVKEFRKVGSDIDDLNALLNEVEKQLQINRSVTEKLKYDTAKGLQQVEMAQRTYDTPIGLQYENSAPLQYFMELSEHFEREMQSMRLQIEATDKYIKDSGKQVPLTHQDLVMGMRRIHEIFVSLAGHLQALHTQVESQKEQYLTLRKYVLNDSTNVFEATNKESEQTLSQLRSFSLKTPSMLASGPTPFGNITHRSVIQAAAQNSPQQTFPSSNIAGGYPYNLGMNFGTNSMMGGSTFGLGTSPTALQLQKPPTGNKRGKQ